MADWSRTRCPLITSTDASEHGRGIATCSSYGPEAVSEIGRVSERSRFVILPGGSARSHALSAAGFVQASTTGRWHAPSDEAEVLTTFNDETCRWGQVKSFLKYHITLYVVRIGVLLPMGNGLSK